MESSWSDLAAAELDVRRLHDVLALRSRVFVVEQASCYLDVDGLDLAPGTRHVLAEAEGALLAYARVLPPGDDGAVHVGRVVVSPEARGLHLGRALMERALASAAAHWPGTPVRISAQAHLQRFYGGLGFTATSGEYDDAGIPHVDMELVGESR